MTHCGSYPLHQESCNDGNPNKGGSERWIHQIDKTSTEPSSTTQPTRAEELEREEQQQEEEEEEEGGGGGERMEVRKHGKIEKAWYEWENVV